MKNFSVKLMSFSCILFFVSVHNAISQEANPYFRPAVFWNSNASAGVLLVAKKEMVVVDSGGNRLGKIVAGSAVSSAAISPDGKKLLYATESGVWHVVLAANTNVKLADGFCDYLRWNNDGASFTFAIYTKDGPDTGSSFGIKFYWADSDGKNLKQVYP